MSYPEDSFTEILPILLFLGSFSPLFFVTFPELWEEGADIDAPFRASLSQSLMLNTLASYEAWC